MLSMIDTQIYYIKIPIFTINGKGLSMARIKPIINDDTAKEPIQVFLARTTEPPKDNSNLNYRLTSAGGYNPCVRGGYSNGRRNTVGALQTVFQAIPK